MNALAQQIENYIGSTEWLIDRALDYAEVCGFKIGRGSDGIVRKGEVWAPDGDPMCPLSAVVLYTKTPATMSHRAAVCTAMNKPWDWVKAWVDGFDGNDYTVGDREAYELGKSYGFNYRDT